MSCKMLLFILLLSEQMDTISCNGRRRTDTFRKTCLYPFCKSLIFFRRLSGFEENFKHVMCADRLESKQSREMTYMLQT